MAADKAQLQRKETVPLGAEIDRSMAAKRADLSLAKVARMFRISRLTLLFYEFRGLIARRRLKGSRTYGWHDLDRIAFILKSQGLGLSLSDIEPIIRASDNLESAPLVERAKYQCAYLIDTLKQQRLEIDEYIGELEHRFNLLLERRSDPIYATP